MLRVLAWSLARSSIDNLIITNTSVDKDDDNDLFEYPILLPRYNRLTDGMNVRKLHINHSVASSFYIDVTKHHDKNKL